MYQQPQQQQPLYALPQLPQQPLQPSAFDEAAKLIDLIDKINQRRSGGNIEPGLSQTSQFNTSQFQPANQQQLAQQELLLKNPQLLQQNQQQLEQLQQLQQFQGQQQQQSASQEVIKLQEKNKALAQGVGAINNYNAVLSDYAKFAGLYATFANGLANQIEPLTQMAVIGDGALKVMNSLLHEKECLEDMVSVLKAMLQNPYYLLYHSFEVWNSLVGAQDGDFVNLFSEAYMSLVRNFEERYRMAAGNYTPQYTDYLQSQISQQYPGNIVPTQQVQQQVSAIKQFAEGLNSSGFGKQMQRMHSQQRQMVG